MSRRGSEIGGFVVPAAILFFLFYANRKNLFQDDEMSNQTTSNYINRLMFRILGVNLNGINSVSIRFAIDNPNPSAMMISAITGDIWLNGQKVGNIASYGNKIVKPVNRSIYDLSVIMNTQQMIRLVQQVSTISKSNATIQFRGAITINNKPYLINQSFTWT